MSAQVLVSTKGMSREEWLQWRRRGIGSSDAPAVAGLSPYATPVTVYLDKIGALEDDEDVPERLEWGQRLEDPIAAAFGDKTGYRIRRVNAILQHPEHPFALANLDRLAYTPEGRAPLEVKTADKFTRKEWADNQIPLHYHIQVQHQLLVTGHDFGFVAVLIGGNHLEMRQVERDPELIEMLVQVERDFWDLVENRTPPLVDGSRASTEVLRALYPESRPESLLELPPEARDLLDAYETAYRDSVDAEYRKQLAENRLKVLMRDHGVGVLDGKIRVLWRSHLRSALDTKALKADHPEVYAAYARATPVRPFSVKPA